MSSNQPSNLAPNFSSELSSEARLIIATRASRLALWQANHVKALIENTHPRIQIELNALSTKGDEILDRSLAKIGGKGLFIKELESALLRTQADLAVHSLKDLPMQLEETFKIAAILKREDPRDAFVSNQYHTLADLPENAVVGTSSLRRSSQLLAKYPHLQIRQLRGNLDTRLRKLDEGEFDAIILAAAGLKRLGLVERIQSILSPSEMLPAVGQGALAIETRVEDDIACIAQLHDEETAQCVLAERTLAKALEGGCSTPLAAYCVFELAPENTSKQLYLRALIASEDGARVLSAFAYGIDPILLGEQVAQDLLRQGAAALLQNNV